MLLRLQTVIVPVLVALSWCSVSAGDHVWANVPCVIVSFFFETRPQRLMVLGCCVSAGDQVWVNSLTVIVINPKAKRGGGGSKTGEVSS